MLKCIYKPKLEYLLNNLLIVVFLLIVDNNTKNCKVKILELHAYNITIWSIFNITKYYSFCVYYTKQNTKMYYNCIRSKNDHNIKLRIVKV